jgi:hypothetical protein
MLGLLQYRKTRVGEVQIKVSIAIIGVSNASMSSRESDSRGLAGSVGMVG